MRILIDADACPVIDICIEQGKLFNIEVILFTTINHNLSKYNLKTVLSDTYKESTDLTLINYAKSNDIIITQDYGVASLGLGKKCFPINQNGLVFTIDNIDFLLNSRHISKKERKKGNYTQIPKRTKENNLDFEKALIKVIKNTIEIY
ncbi:MAG: DUF188 domain-containing protein [Lachnospirales bacterium]